MTSRDQIDRWIEAAKENSRRIRECTAHRFDGPVPGDFVKGKLTCKNCGGEMAVMPNILCYIRGYVAAGGNPDDIWLNFKEIA